MPTWSPVGSDLLGAVHLASRKGFEPQRSHAFELLVSIPSGGDEQVLLKTVETAMSISHNSEPLALPYMNETIYIAGRPMYAPGAVVFRDMVDEPVYALLEAWYSLIYNAETSEIGFAQEYKSMATLTMYDTKGGSERSWDMIGIWPQDLSSEAFSYMNSDIFRINITFQYDKAIPRFAY